MSDALATALEEARSRLASGVEEAEVELARARARARELRVSLVMARELTGIDASIERTQRTDRVPRETSRAQLDLTNLPEITLPPGLSLRRRVALEGLRRVPPPTHARACFSPDVVLRWDGDNALAGTYAGRKEALAFLELVLLEIELAVDPEPRFSGEAATVRIEARPALRGAGVRIALTISVEFDERDRIVRLSVTPEEGASLDRLVDALLA